MLIILRSSDFNSFHKQHHPSQGTMTKNRHVPLAKAGQASVPPQPCVCERRQTFEGREYLVDHNTNAVTSQNSEKLVDDTETSIVREEVGIFSSGFCQT